MSIELDRAIGSNHSEEFRGLAAWSSGDLSKYASAMGGAVCLQSADDQQDPQQFLTKAFSMKCSTMAVGNREGSGLIAAGFTGDQADVLLWRDGELLYRLEEHDEAVTALAFTCDDRFLVSTGGMNDQRLYVWDCERGLVITCRSLATLVPVKAIVDGGFVKDVKRRNTSLYQLASCGGRNVTIWELNDEVQSITPVSISPSGKHTRAFECLCFSKDYELLFIGTSSGDIAVVKMRNRVVQSFSEPVGAGGIFSLAYLDAAGDLAQGSSPAVLAGSGDGSVTLFSCILTELRQLKRVVVDQGTIVGMSVGRRRQILCASTTGSVWLLWPDKDMATALVQENTSAPLQAVAYPMPDISTEFAVGDASGAVTLWSCDGSYSVIMKLAARPTASSPVSAVTCLGYLSRAGLLVAGHSDGLLRSWNCGDDNGTLLWTIDTTTTRGRTNRASDVGALAMSSNGRFVVTGGGEGEVRVWEVKSKDMVSGMKEHTSRVNALKLFSNDQFCVTGSRDRCLLTFDLRAEKRLTCHRERHGGIDCLAIGTDENVVVAGGKEKHLTYWDLRQPEPVRVVSAGPGDELKALSFHDDGKGGLLASGGTGCVVKLWEMGSGRLISTHLEEPRHSSCINDLAFSPDGKQLISVGADHCVMVWNVFPNDPPEAGEGLRFLTPHSESYQGVGSVEWPESGHYNPSILELGNLTLCQVNLREAITRRNPRLSQAWNLSPERSSTPTADSPVEELPAKRRRSSEASCIDLMDATQVEIPENDARGEASSVQEEPSGIECAICLCPAGPGATVGTLHANASNPEPSCSHRFCFDCIYKWSKATNLCPLCKGRFGCIRKHKVVQGDVMRPIEGPFGLVRIRKKDMRPEDFVTPPGEDAEIVQRYNDLVCEACHEGTSENALLICEMCDRGYHTFCLRPRLTAVPLDDWFCPECQQAICESRAMSPPVRRSLRLQRRTSISSGASSPIDCDSASSSATEEQSPAEVPRRRSTEERQPAPTRRLRRACRRDSFASEVSCGESFIDQMAREHQRRSGRISSIRHSDVERNFEAGRRDEASSSGSDGDVLANSEGWTESLLRIRTLHKRRSHGSSLDSRLRPRGY